jgi:hypothetical protein
MIRIRLILISLFPTPSLTHSSWTLGSEICPRLETVETLTNLLEEYGLVHVRGIPGQEAITLSAAKLWRQAVKLQ